MKHFLYLSILTLSFPLPTHTMEEKKTQEKTLQEKLTQLSLQLDQLQKRDDAPQAAIDEIHRQLTQPASALDSITKQKESLD
jgi:hypothetical protein